MSTITFKDIRESEEIQTYIKRADLSLERMGYTEHSFAHVSKVSRIAGYMHDIGNVINSTSFNKQDKLFTVRLTIDTSISSVLEYFEIFVSRMKLCSKASDYLGIRFRLYINNTEMC